MMGYLERGMPSIKRLKNHIQRRGKNEPE